DTLEAYSTEPRNLNMKILNPMAKALRREPREMKELFEEGDASGLTILLQLNELEGLQIRKDGMWVPVKPRQDAFIINIGDILERLNIPKYRAPCNCKLLKRKALYHYILQPKTGRRNGSGSKPYYTRDSGIVLENRIITMDIFHANCVENHMLIS
ncbi:hypothetical protein Ddye_024459, partial [Dipteronia dyeriana]